jgi:hypothetical protein
MLVADTLVGCAILKVQGNINGQSTDWVELKSPQDGAHQPVGKVLVSISRETLE